MAIRETKQQTSILHYTSMPNNWLSGSAFSVIYPYSFRSVYVQEGIQVLSACALRPSQFRVVLFRCVLFLPFSVIGTHRILQSFLYLSFVEIIILLWARISSRCKAAIAAAEEKEQKTITVNSVIGHILKNLIGS